jgi:hypothetical protein
MDDIIKIITKILKVKPHEDQILFRFNKININVARWEAYIQIDDEIQENIRKHLIEFGYGVYHSTINYIIIHTTIPEYNIRLNRLELPSICVHECTSTVYERISFEILNNIDIDEMLSYHEYLVLSDI